MSGIKQIIFQVLNIIRKIGGISLKIKRWYGGLSNIWKTTKPTDVVGFITFNLCCLFES